MQYLTLSNNKKIPAIGYGTYKSQGDDAKQGTIKALIAGYRLIDTAAFYANEKQIGEAIKEAQETLQIKREDIFLTSKVWNTDRGYENTIKAFNKTIKELDQEYLDLYLIHWPASQHQFDNWEEINTSTWQAMTDLCKDGRIRAIGVCNCKPHHLEALMQTEIKPMVNQIEYRAGFTQKETADYCKQNNIRLQAWTPLGRGQILNDEHIQKTADKYNKTPAQIAIRFCIDTGVIPLPKSTHEDRIKENLNVFDFALTQDDIDELNKVPVPEGKTHDPDLIDF